MIIVGEKPFVCRWSGEGGPCNWRFSRSDELARHAGVLLEKEFTPVFSIVKIIYTHTCTFAFIHGLSAYKRYY
jgi:hypothetical protein